MWLVAVLLALSRVSAFKPMFGRRQGAAEVIADDYAERCKGTCDDIAKRNRELTERIKQLEAELDQAKKQGKPSGGSSDRAFGPEMCGPKTYRLKVDTTQDGPLPLLEDRMPQLSGDPPLMEVFGNDPGIEKGDLSSCTKMTFFFHQVSGPRLSSLLLQGCT